MDRRILFIGGGILLALAIAIILILVLSGGSARPDEAAQRRLNTLALAQEYLDRGEYQRALDLIDQLLIENARDVDARGLRDSVIDAKQAADQAARETTRQEQEALKDTIAESIKESTPTVVVTPPPEPEPQPKPEPTPEPKEDPAVAAARAAEEARRAEEARQAAARKAEEAKKAQDVSRLIDEGISAMKNEQYDAARERFTQALAIDGNVAEAYAQMGESFFREDSGNEQNLQKAVEYSNKAVEKDHTYWLPHFTLGQIYQQTKSWDNAIKEFGEAARLNPERDDIWYELGKVQFRASDFAAAAESFNTASHLNPKNDKAFYNLGVTYERLNRPQDALNAYSAAAASNPEYALAYYSAGLVLMSQKNYRQAIPQFQKSVALSPTEMRYVRDLATAQFFSGDLASAEKNYRKAYSLGPDQPENNYNLAVVLLRLQKNDEALQYAAKAVQLDPENATAPYLFTLGEAAGRVGESDTAIIAYQKAVDADPDYLNARINLGKLYDENGMYDRALTQLLAAYRISSDSIEVNNNLGNVYLHQKLYRDAIRHYQKAIAKKPDATLMRYHLAIAYIETKQNALATDTLLELVKIDAQFWDAYYQLGKIYYAEGNTDQAAQIFKTLLEKQPDYPNKDEIERLLAG